MITKDPDLNQHLQVLSHLRADPALSGVEIGIAFEDGVVTLYGRVGTREQKLAAERAALRVPGVLVVAVEIVDDMPRWRGDTEIAHAVAEYLRGEHLAPPDAVRASVERARVTLSGAVDLFHQRDALERGVRDLAGVGGVVNLLRVRPPEAQADIHTKVHSAVIREMESLDPESLALRRPGETESKMIRDKKILIIDDDDDFRASLRPVLEGEGYLVFEGKSGHEGLALLVEQNPDAIVLDIMMETNEEGYGVNQAIKFKDEYKQYRGTPIVMVSSIQETPDDRFPRAVEVDMIRPDAYFTKPVDLDRFLDAVRRMVTRKVRT